MTAKYGYCSKCGTPLECEILWEENKSSFGPAGHNFESYYCPKCRADEKERERHKKYIEEQKRIKKEEERQREIQSKRLKRLENYKKYMPKKVTSIVLTYQEAKHLYKLLDKEYKELERKEQFEKDNIYIDEVLIEKVKKAKEETNYSYQESFEFAKQKGWEKEEQENNSNDSIEDIDNYWQEILKG